jgi:two-component system sensor histidine kinase KdpD
VEAPRESSPAERVRYLEEIADTIARERKQASESHRVVAHELRTPLTSIRGLAQLLAAYDLSDDERRRVAAMVADESTRLHDMVEGLLDLERLSLRERGEGMQLLDVAEILAKRAGLARAVGTHEITLSCDETLPLHGDTALLERLVENLVGNAMKFSPAGSTVTLRGMAHDRDVVLEVEDEGPGIPPEERESVLTRFGRGRSASDRPGLGLGLAFVAEIVRWHGGHLEVDEGALGGACLRVRLSAGAGQASKESIA